MRDTPRMWMRPRARDVVGALGVFLTCVIVLGMAPDSLIVLSLILPICGLATAVIAQRKGWSGEGLLGWFILGAAVPIIGLMAVVFRRPLGPRPDGRAG